MKKLNVTWVRESFSHMGLYSGYDQLCSDDTHWSSINANSVWRHLDRKVPFIPRKALNQILRRDHFSPFYDVKSAYAELSVLIHCLHSPQDIIHINYGENNLGYLSRYRQHLKYKLVVTNHQPVSWWKLMYSPESLTKIDSLIVLSKREAEYFEEFLPGKVTFIPHGVNTSFFHPASSKKSAAPRCVFSGSWLRDVETLVCVVERLLKLHQSIEFDMVVPLSNRHRDIFYRLASNERVRWHAKVDDNELRSIYQNASLLLLPLLDCTANNALLEAMSCGLPIVSNSIGGMLDYTNQSFASLVSRGDVDGFTEAVLDILGSTERQKIMGTAARDYAQKNFDWKVISQATLDLYRQICDT
jgi:glycosyltransferase involved in cell wall biosynthesis